MRGTRLWLILCTVSPLIAAPPSSNESLLSKKRLNAIASRSSAQHEFVAHLVHHLRKQAISAILRLELFTIASGNHLTIPLLDENDDVKLHRSGKALIRLWTRLATMERVDSIINNVTVEVANHSAIYLTDENIINAVFEGIEQRLKNESSSLFEEYLELQHTVSTAADRHNLFFSTDDCSGEQFEEFIVDWIADSNLKKFFVNKLFLQQTIFRPKSFARNPREFEYFKTAKSLIRLAQNENWTSTVQPIYDQTIDEVAEGFSMAEHPYESNSRIFKNYEHELRVDVTTPKLFDKLTEKCRALPKLYGDLQAIRVKLDSEKISESRDDYVINLFPL